MARKRNDHQVQDGQSLKGTFLSVMLLGGFIVLTWLGVFILYINRG